MVGRCVPAGLLGRYYAVRLAHGQYNSCGTAGSYIVSHSLQKNFDLILKCALAKTIDRHPSLCYGLIGKTTTSDAHFFRLSNIHYDDVIENLPSFPSDQDADERLSKIIGVGHQHFFTNQDQKPAWKLIVQKYLPSIKNHDQRIDIAFISCHAIGDGTSGPAFHKILLESLQITSSLPELPVASHYVVPDNVAMPIAVEDTLPILKAVIAQPAIQVTEPPQSKSTATTSASQIHTFSDSIKAKKEDYKSRVIFIAIPSSSVPGILKQGRLTSSTLTSLIHALITLYLAKSIPSAHTFRAITPISLRRFSNTPNIEICNHISHITSTWLPPLLDLARAASENSQEETDFVRRVSEQFNAEVKLEMDTIPHHGPTGLMAAAKITDLDAYCEQIWSKPRGETYELSNVGVVDIPTIHGLGAGSGLGANGEVEGGNGIRLEKLVFTQCGMPAGAALACNVVSLKGGPLVLSLTWQEGAIDEDVVVGLKQYLERRLLAMGDRKGNLEARCTGMKD